MPEPTLMLVLPGYSHFILWAQHSLHEAFSLHTHMRPMPNISTETKPHRQMYLLCYITCNIQWMYWPPSPPPQGDDVSWTALLPVLLLGHSPGPCSLSLLMHILDLLTLLPPLMHLHNMHVITLVDFQHSLIGHPQSEIAFIRLAREQKLPHGFVFIVASHEEEVRKK